MELNHEKSLIALKQFLHRLGYDKNKAEQTIAENKTKIKPAMEQINSHLFQFPNCIIANQWKEHFISFLKKQTGTTPNPLERAVFASSTVPLDGEEGRALLSPAGHRFLHMSQTTPESGSELIAINDNYGSVDVSNELALSAPGNPVRSTRQHHLVSTLSQRLVVIQWMVEENAEFGKSRLAAKAIANFPHMFSGSYKANHAKATAWWKQKDLYLSTKKEGSRTGLISGRLGLGVKRANFKSLPVRGRKRSDWVIALYEELLEEFERMQSASIKISPSLLVCAAKALILEAPPQSPFHRSVLCGNYRIGNKISYRWIQSFMMNHQLVHRSQSGSLSVSPEKQIQIEKEVAAHLGELKRGFDSGFLDENCTENDDETHFIFNMDNGRTIGFRAQEEVRYADVVSGNEEITMMVRITGGADAHIEVPMLVFINNKCSYPIQGVPDNVPGVCYRTGRRGWMDKRVFSEWLAEKRAIQKLSGGRTRVLFVDNANGHGQTPLQERNLKKVKTVLRKFPTNATHLVQPADSFIISKIKDAWRRRWDAYKVQLIRDSKWKPGVAGSSGKLVNPGKRFFLRLAADSVRDVNHQRDSNGISFARKAMVRIDMSLNYDLEIGKSTKWEESQLFSNLQEIISKHRSHFEGDSIES